MRWFFAALLALFVSLAIYVGSALWSLNGLVEAARGGDGVEVIARTDVKRLKRSLVDQIVAEYLKRIGQDRPVKPLERLVANTYGASVADALIAKMLTAENLTDLLQRGSVPGVGTGLNIVPLTQLDTSQIWRTLARVSVVKPVEISIQIREQDQSAISLHFEGNSWKLSGVQLPREVLRVLAESLPGKAKSG